MCVRVCVCGSFSSFSGVLRGVVNRRGEKRREREGRGDMERSFEEKRGEEEMMTEVKNEGEEESRGEVRETKPCPSLFVPIF